MTNKLLIPIFVLLISCLSFSGYAFSEYNFYKKNTSEVLRNGSKINKSKEGDVMKQAKDKILISGTRDGDVLKSPALPQ